LYIFTVAKNYVNVLCFFSYFLPDPPAIPTKEGGAELDVSGVWTFTPMSPDIGINESGTSATKLLKTPNGISEDRTAADAMLMLLGPRSNFPAGPRMRKQPHQCSTHSIGVLSSPTTCSSPLSLAHHRSVAFLSSESNRSGLENPSIGSSFNPSINTRSCGTNVNNYHHRSVSAIADHRRTVSYVIDDVGQIQHQRSLSSQQQHQQQQHQDERRPPALPPKVGVSGSIYRLSDISTPTKSEGSSTSASTTMPLEQFSFLQQLVQSSPNPELLDTLRRHKIEPRPPPATRAEPKAVTRSPSCAASLFTHQRAVSMLEPVTSYNDAPMTTSINGRYVKHIRSSSTLAPMPETPSSRRV